MYVTNDFTRLFVTLLFALIPIQVAAGATAADQVTAKDPYVRAVPPGQTNSAAFMRLQNAGSEGHALVSASSPAAKTMELHTHLQEDGMMKMREVDRIDLPSGMEVVLEPGGLHLMLIGLKGPLVPDQDVEITLKFADGSEKELLAPVRKLKMHMH